MRYTMSSLCAGRLSHTPLARAGGRAGAGSCGRARTDENPGAIGLALTTILLTVAYDKDGDFP